MSSLSKEQQRLAKELTVLQRKFITQLVKPQTSRRKAYIKAGGKANSPEAQDSAASTMFKNVKVRAFYDSLTEEAVNSSILTREQALEILSKNANEAEECRDQHTAIKQLSTMQGWEAPKKTELTGKDGTAININADVSAPEVVAALDSLMSRL